MTVPGYDEYGRVLMSSVYSSPDRRALMRTLQTVFPDFYYEDEERSVWATAVGDVICKAVGIASDPNGPFSRVSPSPLAIQAMHRSHGAAWVVSTIARAIERSFTKSMLLAITDSAEPERASCHVASEAINTICRDWSRPPSKQPSDT